MSEAPSLPTRSAASGSAVRIRLADAARDAAAVSSIYRPSVEEGLASFEVDAPSPDEMARRMSETLSRTPWLVADEAGEVVGYAYASPHQMRAGYRWSVNVSAYVRADRHGRGIGRRLYEVLVSILRAQRFANVYAGITQPNPASVALHEAIGMRPVGTYRRVGHKHGAWHDVTWYELRLADPPEPPAEPIPLPELATLDRLLADAVRR